MSMYRFNDDLLKITLQNQTKKYTLNQLYKDKRTIDAFITNATLSPNSSYHLHSLQPFGRGDILTLNSSYYLVTSDIVEQRVSKYKGIVDYCNFKYDVILIKDVTVGYDEFGRPIEEEQEVLDRSEYGVFRYKDISISNENAINFVNPIYTLFLRDTDENRAYFTVNKKIKIEEKELRVFNIVYVKRGLLEIRLQ